MSTLMAAQWWERKDAGVDVQEGMLDCVRYCIPPVDENKNNISQA